MPEVSDKSKGIFGKMMGLFSRKPKDSIGPNSSSTEIISGIHKMLVQREDFRDKEYKDNLKNSKAEERLEKQRHREILKALTVKRPAKKTIEKKIETQLSTVDTCSKILKSIFEKEGLSDNVKLAIETLTEKLEQVENYYAERPISEMEKRYTTKTFSKGKDITFLVCSKEDRINSRTRVMEKIYKVKPIITELENMKEEVIAKGGYEIPESMIYE